MSEDPIFRLSDYDCIGFDLDNTLSEYHLWELCALEYKLCTNYLVQQKGYNPNVFGRLENDIIFIRKGLILDIEKGNILDLGVDGLILKASHGTKFLTEEELVNIYGTSKHWDIGDIFINNYIETWNGPLSFKIRALLDYFDIILSFLFAKIVDFHDLKSTLPINNYDDIWTDLLSCLYSMYSRENFSTDTGGYFHAVKTNPTRYIKIRSNQFVNWLKSLKKNKLIFLVTGSNADYANLVAETSLGKNWKQYFDVIVFYARKPGFFNLKRPFFNLRGFEEMEIVTSEKLQIGNSYSQGNWSDMYELFKRFTKKENPKCLYIGDNLLQDIWAPVQFLGIDTVAVVNEMVNESVTKEDHLKNKNKKNVWGSYFNNNNQLTTWGRIINTYSQICVPNVNIFADKTLDFKFNSFHSDKDVDCNTRGYFPSAPRVLK